eukprot:CAMPEP_0206491798 /NCGR_PEP_ID=MMETSP0324_2-20121206/45410_1 /ASSEMBLY_ACC=CAM_ASM_000836 /TAXON_ID=2866 /ORGANISM="Crypthecodinium cohnii, Strain Seligo" /LENGTH=69 /DNA_ID=CAMNT_0053973457 /DNA_START=37 /DNA_END=243 /DNA_ORIENTATION=+
MSGLAAILSMKVEAGSESPRSSVSLMSVREWLGDCDCGIVTTTTNHNNNNNNTHSDDATRAASSKSRHN